MNPHEMPDINSHDGYQPPDFISRSMHCEDCGYEYSEGDYPVGKCPACEYKNVEEA